MTLLSSAKTMESNNIGNPTTIDVEVVNSANEETEPTNGEGREEQSHYFLTKRTAYCALGLVVFTVVVVTVCTIALGRKSNHPSSSNEADPGYEYLDPFSPNNNTSSISNSNAIDDGLGRDSTTTNNNNSKVPDDADYNYLDPGSDNSSSNNESTIDRIPGGSNNENITVPNNNYPIPNDNSDYMPSQSFCDSTNDFCWIQLGNTLPSSSIPGIDDDDFRSIVSISDDGSRVLACTPTSEYGGIPGAGLIQIYDLDSNGIWKQWGDDIVGESDNEGIVGVMSGNGQRIAVLSRVAELLDKDISVFDISPSKPMKLGGTIRIGTDNWDFVSVDLDSGGNTIVIGSPQYRVGFLQVYVFDGNDWMKRGQEIVGNGSLDERLGDNVWLSDDAMILATSSYFLNTNRGFAKVFRLEDDKWVLGESVTGETAFSWLGQQFCLSSSGQHFAASSQDSTDYVPLVSIYSFQSGKLAEDIKLNDGETIVGLRLSSDGTRLAVSRQLDGIDSDHAFLNVYDLSDGFWKQVGGTITFENNSVLYRSMDMTSDGSRVIVGGTRQNMNFHSIVFAIQAPG